METARVKKTDVYSAGFIIGPRLNAAGRIIDANLALDLILTDNYIKAHDLAGELDEMNARRQAIQNKILLDADDLAKKQKDANRFCLFVSGDDWHGGVMGIVAGRLKEKYGLPCCVATRSKASVKGSGRSIEGVDIGKIIRLALENGIISEGGGHKAAAGFELAPENEQRFSDFLDNEVKSALNGIYPIPKINADIEMDAGGATLELAENIEKLAPFGIGNTEPILCLSGGMWTFGRTIGTGAHLSGNLKTSAGNLSVVGFNMSDTPIGRFLLDESNFGCKIRVVGRLKENDFSSNVQLLLEDIAL
jgi:single-stranded-DNA-specific exonuclease